MEDHKALLFKFDKFEGELKPILLDAHWCPVLQSEKQGRRPDTKTAGGIATGFVLKQYSSPEGGDTIYDTLTTAKPKPRLAFELQLRSDKPTRGLFRNDEWYTADRSTFYVRMRTVAPLPACLAGAQV